MTLKNNRTPLLCYFKLYASFHSHWWIRTGVTVQKRPIWVKIGDFFVLCDLEIRQMTLNKANLRDLIAATGLVILLKLDSNRRFFSLCDLEIWWMTQKNNRAPLLCYFKLFASFRSHWWIQTGVTVRKHQIWVKIDNFFQPCDLKIWRMTFKNNSAPLLCYFKLCAAFCSHWWIQTGVTVRKRLIWVKINDFF